MYQVLLTVISIYFSKIIDQSYIASHYFVVLYFPLTSLFLKFLYYSCFLDPVLLFQNHLLFFQWLFFLLQTPRLSLNLSPVVLVTVLFCFVLFNSFFNLYFFYTLCLINLLVHKTTITSTHLVSKIILSDLKYFPATGIVFNGLFKSNILWPSLPASKQSFVIHSSFSPIFNCLFFLSIYFGQ